MLLEIRLLGDPVLREECAPVEQVDDEIRQLIEDLQETMYAVDGLGLAAPQVGVPIRMFVYDVRDPELQAGVLINPEIVEAAGSVREEEGCLSLPGLTEIVERNESILVRGLNAEGESIELRAEGLLSRCIQHENDHLDGILFLDRVSPLKRKLLLQKWQKGEN
jgi:peptide deformylase